MENPICISHARDEYLAWCYSRLTRSTVGGYRDTINVVIRVCGDLPLAEFRTQHVEEFLTYLRRDHHDGHGRHRPPVGPRGWNAYLGRMRIFCRWMQGRGLMPADITTGVYRMRLPTPNRLRLTAEQVRAMLERAPTPRARAVIAVGFFAALRAAEVKTLRVQDVDLASNTLMVTVWKSLSEDEFPISPDFHEELQRWLSFYQGEVRATYGRDLSPQDFLIPAHHGHAWGPGSEMRNGRHVRPSRPTVVVPWKPYGPMYEVVHGALKSIDVPPAGEGMHTLRRTAARLLFDTVIEQGHYESAIRIVQATLHHKSSRTTEDYIGIGSEKRARDEFIRSTRLLPATPRLAVRAGDELA